jgi:hypothetical protein
MLLCLAAGPAFAAKSEEARLIQNSRQLTFEGRRAGEGYFSRDSAMMVFQSEREAGNPFYQIYLMDLETGDTRRMSPGTGKTTCAWIHPAGDKVLFASTHLDPDALKKQQEEFGKRAAGKARRYAWSFDPNYDIFEVALDGGPLRNLTDAMGYDAEGSWSPGGEHILFASNRHAYTMPLSPAEQGVLTQDPSYFMELYIMKPDGSDLRRLTDVPGYDGGPFFSHDGSKIVWRRFAPDGGSAEIYTMNRDGTGEKAITRLGAVSWAPFFHPSGDYVIFSTSVHGFGNFELYMVDAEGRSEPVRVTHSEGFDGLPVFTPDGNQLSWSSRRSADKSPQIFLAAWNDAEARRLLALAPRAAEGSGEGAVPALPATEAAIAAADLRRHVQSLASADMEGRLTGSAGGRRAARYLAEVFRNIGIEPAGDDGSYFQAFEFTASVALGPGNRLSFVGLERTPAVDRDWRPIGFSISGTTGPAEVVFASYGIVAPGAEGDGAYDSYGDLDVEGKWVLVLRYLPEDITPERRQHLNRYAELNYKGAVARARGALGLIVATGPTAPAKERLVPLTFEAAGAGGDLAAISVSDTLAEAMLGSTGKTLRELQEALDTGEALPGFTLPDLRVTATIRVIEEKGIARNVLGRLRAGDRPSESRVIVGAHYDHLGRGVEGKTLARPGEAGEIHYGADDNASGVAALLEIAEHLADLKASAGLPIRRDILFAAWSGEELGLLGSTHFTNTIDSERETLQPEVVAYLNMDMVGRLEEHLVLQGVGSSSLWPREIERRNVPIGLSIVTNDSAFVPTDAMAFYLKGVPVLNAFTGAHADYSTPRDTADKLNYQGMRQVARLIDLIARSLAAAEEVPDYVREKITGRPLRRRGSRAYLGTIPDYTQTNETGVRISGVAKNSPAETAGLKVGDLVVELAGRNIANIYDYSHALDGLKVGEAVRLVVRRDGTTVTLAVTAAPRE